MDLMNCEALADANRLQTTRPVLSGINRSTTLA
jgi:hypothetical protein